MFWLKVCYLSVVCHFVSNLMQIGNSRIRIASIASSHVP